MHVQASRLRQSATGSTPQPSRHGASETPGGRSSMAQATTRDVRRLPEYELPMFPMNQAAQRQLAALAKSSSLKNLDGDLKAALGAVSGAALAVNDRFHEKEEFATEFRKRKRKDIEQGRQPEEGEEQIDVDANIEELRKKVDGMTQRMDEKMQKLIDAQHEVKGIKDSLISTVEDAQRFASTQASTQNLRSQRRTRQTAGSDGEEGEEDLDEEEEYPEINPTDPTNATQGAKSMKDAFTTRHEDAKTRYQSHTRAERYAENNDYISFRKLVHDARYPSGEVQLPHARTWFPAGDVPAPGITARPTSARRNGAANDDEDGDEEEDDDDDDLAIAREQISTKCPLTLREFEDPITSKKCNHSFERTGTLEFIGGNRNGQAQCPVSGCRETLRKSDLEVDRVIVRQIKRIQRARMLQDNGDGGFEDDEDGEMGNGLTQRNAAVIEDEDEDAEDVDTVLGSQPAPRIKGEPRSTLDGGFAPPQASLQPIDLGESSGEESG
ncbi:hypothetical protein D0862_09464 [Hortaea werneckii]|uniref:SP-RING-type domain-containing protein n=1 Tax=Hortaea werneckii TaxID=91943 RepID=A0A3M7FUK8_HORWE|nr:hypothetical protein D0862_09464 [Hortaea werneckii]